MREMINMKNRIEIRDLKADEVNLKSRWFDEDLPALIESDLRRSLGWACRMWALDFANPAKIGRYSSMEEYGLLLQNAGNYQVRCLLAADMADARIGLAMFKSSFNAVGVELQIGDYTVVAPFEAVEEIESEQVNASEIKDVATGVEVC